MKPVKKRLMNTLRGNKLLKENVIVDGVLVGWIPLKREQPTKKELKQFVARHNGCKKTHANIFRLKGWAKRVDKLRER